MDDRDPDIETNSILSAGHRRFWPIEVPNSHKQLRNLISIVHDDRIYLVSAQRILCLHPSTGAYEFLCAFHRSAQCLAAHGKWVVAGSDTCGMCFFVKVTESGYRAVPPRRRPTIGHIRRLARSWVTSGGRARSTEIFQAPYLINGPREAFSMPLFRDDPAENDSTRARARGDSEPRVLPSEEAAALRPDIIAEFADSTVNSLHAARLHGRRHGYADEDIVVIATGNKTMTVFSLTRWSILSSETFPHSFNRAVVSPDATTIVAVGDCPIVYFFSIEEAADSPATLLANTSSGLRLHDWRFELIAKIVLPLDPGIRQKDACSFAVSFNFPSSLVAIGSQDGSITVLDVEAVRESCQKDVSPEEQEVSPRMVIHTFQSTREPMEGGAVRHLAFSPPPLDLLVWLEDTDYFGVADMRTTFRRRQIVHVDPDDSLLDVVTPYELGVDESDARVSSDQGGHSAPSVPSQGNDSESAGNDGTRDGDARNDDTRDNDTRNNSNTFDGRSTDDDETIPYEYGNDADEYDSMTEGAYGRGGLCFCSAGVREALPYALNPEDEGLAFIELANQLWEQLPARLALRTRQELFFELADPEDVESWSIEHWQSGTDRDVYRARETHCRRYWRDMQQIMSPVQFWLRSDMRRLGMTTEEFVAQYHRLDILRLLEARPPPLRTYINLKWANQLCLHGLLPDGVRAIRRWYEEPARRRRETTGSDTLTINNVCWDRIPSAFHAPNDLGNPRPTNTDGPADGGDQSSNEEEPPSDFWSGIDEPGIRWASSSQFRRQVAPPRGGPEATVPRDRSQSPPHVNAPPSTGAERSRDVPRAEMEDRDNQDGLRIVRSEIRPPVHHRRSHTDDIRRIIMANGRSLLPRPGALAVNSRATGVPPIFRRGAYSLPPHRLGAANDALSGSQATSQTDRPGGGPARLQLQNPFAHVDNGFAMRPQGNGDRAYPDRLVTIRHPGEPGGRATLGYALAPDNGNGNDDGSRINNRIRNGDGVRIGNGDGYRPPPPLRSSQSDTASALFPTMPARRHVPHDDLEIIPNESNSDEEAALPFARFGHTSETVMPIIRELERPSVLEYPDFLRTGLELSGAAWTQSGVLYVSSARGVFEFRVNQNDRKMYPVYSVR